MTLRHAIAALAIVATGLAAATAEDGAKVYQLRTYTTAPEKLDVLLDRFEATNLPLFEKHGITLVGAWTPEPEAQPEGEPRLVYLVSFPSVEAGEAAWKAFSDDPEWQKVFSAEKEEHGQVVTEVETVYLAPTDYSPDPTSKLAQGPYGDEGGVYELRRYTASPGKLENLHARFREHTMELFAKHGMTNVLYTDPVEDGKGAGELLVYLISHPSYVEAIDSWESFSGDPAWQEVYRESQPDGVRLAAKVQREFLRPTAFSPLK